VIGFACRVAVTPSSDSRPSLSLERARSAQAELETWIMSEAARRLPFSELEREHERRAREAQRLLLQAHLELRGTGDLGAAIQTLGEDGPRRLGQRRIHERTVTSIFGDIRARRTGYSAPGTESIHPLDEQAALPRRQYSDELRRRLVIGAIQGPFEEAVNRVREGTGVSIPKLSAERMVAESACDFDEFYDARKPPASRQTGPIVVAGVDGKGVPMVKPEEALRTPRRGKGEKANKKRMATVATVFTQQLRVRTPEEVTASLFATGPRPQEAPSKAARKPEHKRVWASLKESKDTVIASVAAEVERRDPEQSKIRVGVTDGERALQKGVRLSIANVILILDFLHVLEKLWKAAYCFYPEGSPEATEWVKERTLALLRGQVSQVVKGMRQSATKRRIPKHQRKSLDDAARYMLRNKRFMKYHEYLRAGLPIASGAVEGACKNLVKDRMERSGMRWTIDGAEAVLKLRAAYVSGDFEEYWAFHLGKEQERRYPRGRWKVVEE
jgi:hypothetical protein